MTWYTWLEQGRDIRVSVEVLEALARALRLSRAERTHLFQLAGHDHPAAREPEQVIPPELRRVVELWDPFPARITGRRRDVLLWNKADDLIYGWSQLPEGKRNILWSIFMVPTNRQLLVDWEQEAPRSVAALRAEAGQDVLEPDYQELIRELLTSSDDFAALWQMHDVHTRQGGVVKLQHPNLGDLQLEYISLQVPEQPSMRVYLYMPANGESETRLREAAGKRRR